MLVLLFDIARVPHAIGAHDVVEVVPMVDLAAAHGAPHWVRGLAVVRGVTVPIVDLTAYATGNRAEPTYAARIIVVAVGPERRWVGLVAEHATDVETVKQSAIESAPLQIPEAPWLGRVIRRDGDLPVIYLIEPDRLLPSDVRRVLFPPTEAA